MTTLTRPMLIAALIMFSSTAAFAKAKIPFGKRDVLKKVYDLPDTDEFKSKEGNFLDLATLHQEFNIAYILPLYITEEPRLVIFDEKADTYYDVPESELDAIVGAQKLKIAQLNKLPFYTKYGGKMVAILIAGLLIWGAIPSKKQKVTPTNV